LINEVRKNSVNRMLGKYGMERCHAEQVRNLSLIIFDKTKGLIHDLSENDRELLEAGALLHDIGYYISAKGHHKNAQILINRDRLEGFSEREVEIIGKIARYHKGRLPKKRHVLFSKLAAFVRLSDALDRTHCNVVNDMDFVLDSLVGVLVVYLKLNTPSYYFEICKAQDKKDLFEREFGFEVQLRVG